MEIDFKKVSKDTADLSLGHIRSLIESHFVFGYDYKEALEDLIEKKENIKSSFYSTDDIQQNIGFN